MKVIYVPLDERPCNYKYPQYLAGLTGDVEILVPPVEYMGKMKKPGDVDKIWEWIFDNAAECDYAIISVDSMVYGNIINSRIHTRTKEECFGYLGNFIKLKEINPDIEIHAFNLVTRVAAYDSDAEDPFYWKDHGNKIWKYCYLTDKTGRELASSDEIAELEEVRVSIPPEYLKNFLERREINRLINLQCLELVKDGIMDFLVIPKDDCTEYGFAAMDQQVLAKKIQEYRLMDRVMVYPGADEVGCVLFIRIFNKFKHNVPRVYVRYSSTMGPTIVPKYEDRPLNESIKCQIMSLGGIIADSAAESDLLLAVNSPGLYTIEALDQNTKDISFSNYANAAEIINYANYYSVTYGKPYAIADVSFCNGSDNEFMIMAVKNKLFDRICSYGGWNTAQNTIGVVLAHGVLCSYYEMFSKNREKHYLSTKFLLRKIITDWLLQSNIIYSMFQMRNDYPEVDPYRVGEHSVLVLDIMRNMLDEIIMKELGGVFDGQRIRLTNLTLPWNRIFEIDFDLELY